MKQLRWSVVGLLWGAFNVSAQPVITTVAGTDFVFASSGAAALRAPLGDVFGVTVNDRGEIFFSSSTHAMIMKVSPDGTLSVVAGNGIRGFSGDCAPTQ